MYLRFWRKTKKIIQKVIFSYAICYGKIFLQVTERLAKMFLARSKRAQSFLSLCSQQV